MKPKASRPGAANDPVRFATACSSLGLVLIAATGRGVCAVLLGDDRHELATGLQTRFPSSTISSGDHTFDALVDRVISQVEAPWLGWDLPLDLRGTDFQRSVWQALRRIPAGTTDSYTGIAEKIGRPSAVRAVAGACAANPVAVAVPCHRVLRADGGLSGYRWGAARKQWLLQREVRGTSARHADRETRRPERIPSR